jgi:hypothetical protein
MEIIDYSEFATCEANNFLKSSIIFKDNISKSDLYKLAEGKQLIFNEDFPLPFFKIISPMLTIRGSLDTNRITIEFNSADKTICKSELDTLF